MESENKTVPVVTGALGTIQKGLNQNLQLLPYNPSAIVLQKVALMSTAHSIRLVLGLNNSDLLLRSALTSRLPPDN